MIPYRCQLCGETYLGTIEPDRCPYCGASQRQMVTAAEWINYGKIDMSPVSEDYCQKALEIEISNWAFYKLCAQKAETQISEAIFKRLAKHELEHAELLAKMIGAGIPDSKEEVCSDKDHKNFEESHRRESRAIRLYLSAADSAVETRVAGVFRALSEIENEHLKMSNIYK